MEKNFFRRSSTFRNLNFFYLKIILAFKENSEYKINLWSAIVINIVNLIISIFFISIIINNSLVNLSWSRIDFIVYSILILLGSKGYHLFVFKHLSLKIRKGMLNDSKIRPLNILLIESLRSLRGPVLVIFPSLFLLGAYFIFFGDYSNYLLGLSFFIFSFFLFILYYDFLQSFVFFFKGLNLFMTFDSTNKLVSKYTPKAFDNFFPAIFYILPNSLLGFVTIEIFKGNFYYIAQYGIYMIFFFLFLLLAILILWHYGLKKYEAFG